MKRNLESGDEGAQSKRVCLEGDVDLNVNVTPVPVSVSSSLDAVDGDGGAGIEEGEGTTNPNTDTDDDGTLDVIKEYGHTKTDARISNSAAHALSSSVAYLSKLLLSSAMKGLKSDGGGCKIVKPRHIYNAIASNAALSQTLSSNRSSGDAAITPPSQVLQLRGKIIAVDGNIKSGKTLLADTLLRYINECSAHDGCSGLSGAVSRPFNMDNVFLSSTHSKETIFSFHIYKLSEVISRMVALLATCSLHTNSIVIVDESPLTCMASIYQAHLAGFLTLDHFSILRKMYEAFLSAYAEDMNKHVVSLYLDTHYEICKERVHIGSSSSAITGTRVPTPYILGLESCLVKLIYSMAFNSLDVITVKPLPSPDYNYNHAATIVQRVIQTMSLKSKNNSQGSTDSVSFQSDFNVARLTEGKEEYDPQFIYTSLGDVESSLLRIVDGTIYNGNQKRRRSGGDDNDDGGGEGDAEEFEDDENVPPPGTPNNGAGKGLTDPLPATATATTTTTIESQGEADSTRGKRGAKGRDCNAVFVDADVFEMKCYPVHSVLLHHLQQGHRVTIFTKSQDGFSHRSRWVML